MGSLGLIQPSDAAQLLSSYVQTCRSFSF
ncbi:hypothetical protein MTR67_017172, partial [Solanum verrucosum]